MPNMDKLKRKIADHGMNITELAQKIGIDRATLYRRMQSGGSYFTSVEIGLIARELDLTFDETSSIFFDTNEKVKRLEEANFESLIEKAERLVDLLQEAQQIIKSFS